MYEALGEADVDRYKLIAEVSGPSALAEDEVALASASLDEARQRLPQCTDDLEAFAAGELLEVDSVDELEESGAVSPASVVEGAALACYMLSCRLPVTPCGYSASFVQRLLMTQAHCSLLSSKGTSTTLRLSGAVAQAAADEIRSWLMQCVSSEQGTGLLRQLTQDMLSSNSSSSSSSSNIQEPWKGPLVVASRHLLLVLLEDTELSGTALHAVLDAPWETEQDISFDNVHAVQTVLATVPLHTAGDQELVRRKASEALRIAESGESMAEVYPDEVASLLRPFSVAVSCILAVLNAEELHRAMDAAEDRDAGTGSAAPGKCWLGGARGAVPKRPSAGFACRHFSVVRALDKGGAAHRTVLNFVPQQLRNGRWSAPERRRSFLARVVKGLGPCCAARLPCCRSGRRTTTMCSTWTKIRTRRCPRSSSVNISLSVERLQRYAARLLAVPHIGYD
jgi:hypothetical protein